MIECWWMTITLDHPAGLWLFAAVATIVFFARRSLTGLSRGRQLASTAVRVLLAAVLAVALSGPRIEWEADRPAAELAFDPGDHGRPAARRAADGQTRLTLRGPGQVHRDEPFELDAIVHAGRKGDVEVELRPENGAAVVERLHAVPGENRVRFPQRVAVEGVARYTASIRGSPDASAEQSLARAAVVVTARPKVLLVEIDPPLVRPLVTALDKEGIDVAVVPPERLPDAPGELDAYPLVMLSNIPASALTPGQMKALRDYVHQRGGGLVAAGGSRAFTAGQYRDTVLEEALPVVSAAREQSRRPSLALLLVVDRSLSMGEGGAIGLAKEAMRRAVQVLSGDDQIGILAFDESTRWVCPLGPLGDRAKVLAAIDTITAGGRTDMYPAMEKGYRALDEAFAERKHIIVLTDGVSHPGDFLGLARRIAGSGVSISTVALGAEPSGPLLEAIARIGKGNFYRCRTAGQMPEVFALEAARASQSGVHEEPFFAGSQGQGDAGPGKAPALLGYVETQLKPTARTLLRAESGDPLLARWRLGEGVAMAFTSDVQGSWNAAWADWPGFGPFWADVLRQALRKDEPNGYVLRIDRREDGVDCVLDAVDAAGRYVDGAAAELRLVDPQGREQRIEMPQRAPGRYAAAATVEPSVETRIEIRLRGDGRTLCTARRALCPPDASTRHPAAAGGEPPGPEDVLAALREPADAGFAAWPLLLALAAGLFAVDVLLRRGAAASAVR